MVNVVNGEEGSTILLASRQEIARCGLRSIIRKVCQVGTLIEVGLIETVLDQGHGVSSFDLIVLDLDLIQVDSDRVLTSLHSIYPGAKIVILCTHSLRATVAAAIAAGVHGIISKSSSEAVILRAFEKVLNGEIYVPNDIVNEPLANSPEPCRSDLVAYGDLSNRQKEVLDLILAAYSNKQIARRLSLAEGTVKNHVSVLMRKLGVTSRSAVAVAGIQMKFKEDGLAAFENCHSL